MEWHFAELQSQRPQADHESCIPSIDIHLAEMTDFYHRHKKSGRIVAIGELGLGLRLQLNANLLDYDRLQFSSIDIQKKYQLTFYHLLEIIVRNRKRFTYGVLHSFTGTEDEVKTALELGLHIGLNGCSLRQPENAPWCLLKRSSAGVQFYTQHLNGHQTVDIDHDSDKEAVAEGLRSISALQKDPSKWSSDYFIKGRNEPALIRYCLLVNVVMSDGLSH
ncbi:deoxyribonuclease TATDN1-like protein [Mitosporidium daphniae]|uniref:Deoxyribonuclease TATDN1-like protein n=1 Tax=Mitosporidium daphniae TaxID=1485682 RepID=A0A098VR70_9MICR|nr:deoxyribonuclease TATDN1-like protein [Mitosporidium daphniae]KGG50241.1 deoxyribonuclease TATDN1-like protein [Mitosporidium daphniae]|eukprot:XP_013236668.1 deoxyribonuclease TATDN1-like protein [Mitosporidium daphniae]